MGAPPVYWAKLTVFNELKRTTLPIRWDIVTVITLGFADECVSKSRWLLLVRKDVYFVFIPAVPP